MRVSDGARARASERASERERTNMKFCLWRPHAGYEHTLLFQDCVTWQLASFEYFSQLRRKLQRNNTASDHLEHTHSQTSQHSRSTTNSLEVTINPGELSRARVHACTHTHTPDAGRERWKSEKENERLAPDVPVCSKCIQMHRYTKMHSSARVRERGVWEKRRVREEERLTKGARERDRWTQTRRQTRNSLHEYQEAAARSEGLRPGLARSSCLN